ncbi:hypothetical protein ACLBV5_09610 [Brevundimonas sp. M1A4_2e]
MTTSAKAPAQTLDVQLAVLNTKLDGIKDTLDVRLTNMDTRINDNAAAIKQVERHSDAAVIAQGEAMTKALEKKTDQRQSEERYSGINERIGKIESHMKWVVYLIVGAVITAVLAMVVIKPDRPTNPTAQLTVPAIVQQHAPVQNHPPEASK